MPKLPLPLPPSPLSCPTPPSAPLFPSPSLSCPCGSPTRHKSHVGSLPSEFKNQNSDLFLRSEGGYWCNWCVTKGLFFWSACLRWVFTCVCSIYQILWSLSLVGSQRSRRAVAAPGAWSPDEEPTSAVAAQGPDARPGLPPPPREAQAEAEGGGRKVEALFCKTRLLGHRALRLERPTL